MIELNKKTQQDFLNREWVQRLLDAGVDMSDAKYALYRLKDTTSDIVVYQGTYFADDRYYNGIKVENMVPIVPTYTVSELLYKLHEWIYPTIDGKEFSGPLTFLKDAPFYIFYYRLTTEDYDPLKPSGEQKKEWNEEYIFAPGEYPIESLASVLLQCQKKDIGIKCKNINISDK